MAQPSVVRYGGERTDGDTPPRLLPTPFLTKTYQLVDDQAVDDIISWNAEGSTFIVWNPTEFARDLLPKYFKHNNFSSFIRQLNTYGFRKVMPDRWEFSNDCFRRGEKTLLCDIQRRKIATPPSTTSMTPSVEAAVQPTLFTLPLPVSPSDSGEEQMLSSSISPAAFLECSGSTSELMGENDRLQKENVHLNKELSHMKSICNNIYVLMSNYSGSNENNSSNGYQEDSCKSSLTESKPLDLLPLTSYCKEMEIGAVGTVANGGDERNIGSCPEEIKAKLFGVPIGGTKRERESSGTPAEEQMDLQLQQPGRDIKFEPLDQDKQGDNQESSWTRW